MYRILDVDCTIETLRVLNQRIEERFPDSGLSRVCKEVHLIARETKERILWTGKRLTSIWVAVVIVVACTIAGLGYMFETSLPDDNAAKHSFEEIDAAANVLILSGAFLFWLTSLESRIKRRRLLSSLHDLRSVSHVVDMHQLTKDPSQLLTTAEGQTQSSPRRSLTAFELTRYLDYCSELLSLVAKLAALYAQTSSDGIVLQAVNDVEQLTTSLNRMIWQKIMMLDNDVDELAKKQPLSPR